jgi:hypothetical protein
MPLRRRRPLLRAAAVGGGAYMAGKSRARSQERESQPAAAAPAPAYAAPAPAAPAGPSDDAIAKLTQLGQLHEQGILTDEEFTRQKTLLLGG